MSPWVVLLTAQLASATQYLGSIPAKYYAIPSLDNPTSHFLSEIHRNDTYPQSLLSTQSFRILGWSTTDLDPGGRRLMSLIDAEHSPAIQPARYFVKPYPYALMDKKGKEYAKAHSLMSIFSMLDDNVDGHIKLKDLQAKLSKLKTWDDAAAARFVKFAKMEAKKKITWETFQEIAHKANADFKAESYGHYLATRGMQYRIAEGFSMDPTQGHKWIPANLLQAEVWLPPKLLKASTWQRWFVVWWQIATANAVTMRWTTTDKAFVPKAEHHLLPAAYFSIQLPRMVQAAWKALSKAMGGAATKQDNSLLSYEGMQLAQLSANTNATTVSIPPHQPSRQRFLNLTRDGRGSPVEGLALVAAQAPEPPSLIDQGLKWIKLASLQISNVKTAMGWRTFKLKLQQQQLKGAQVTFFLAQEAHKDLILNAIKLYLQYSQKLDALEMKNARGERDVDVMKTQASLTCCAVLAHFLLKFMNGTKPTFFKPTPQCQPGMGGCDSAEGTDENSASLERAPRAHPGDVLQDFLSRGILKPLDSGDKADFYEPEDFEAVQPAQAVETRSLTAPAPLRQQLAAAEAEAATALSKVGRLEEEMVESGMSMLERESVQNKGADAGTAEVYGDDDKDAEDDGDEAEEEETKGEEGTMADIFAVTALKSSSLWKDVMVKGKLVVTVKPGKVFKVPGAELVATNNPNSRLVSATPQLRRIEMSRVASIQWTALSLKSHCMEVIGKSPHLKPYLDDLPQKVPKRGERIPLANMYSLINLSDEDAMRCLTGPKKALQHVQTTSDSDRKVNIALAGYYTTRRMSLHRLAVAFRKEAGGSSTLPLQTVKKLLYYFGLATEEVMLGFPSKVAEEGTWSKLQMELGLKSKLKKQGLHTYMDEQAMELRDRYDKEKEGALSKGQFDMMLTQNMPIPIDMNEIHRMFDAVSLFDKLGAQPLAGTARAYARKRLTSAELHPDTHTKRGDLQRMTHSLAEAIRDDVLNAVLVYMTMDAPETNGKELSGEIHWDAVEKFFFRQKERRLHANDVPDILGDPLANFQQIQLVTPAITDRHNVRATKVKMNNYFYWVYALKKDLVLTMCVRAAFFQMFKNMGGYLITAQTIPGLLLGWYGFHLALFKQYLTQAKAYQAGNEPDDAVLKAWGTAWFNLGLKLQGLRFSTFISTWAVKIGYQIGQDVMDMGIRAQYANLQLRDVKSEMKDMQTASDIPLSSEAFQKAQVHSQALVDKEKAIRKSVAWVSPAKGYHFTIKSNCSAILLYAKKVNALFGGLMKVKGNLKQLNAVSKKEKYGADVASLKTTMMVYGLQLQVAGALISHQQLVLSEQIIWCEQRIIAALERKNYLTSLTATKLRGEFDKEVADDVMMYNSVQQTENDLIINGANQEKALTLVKTLDLNAVNLFVTYQNLLLSSWKVWFSNAVFWLDLLGGENIKGEDITERYIYNGEDPDDENDDNDGDAD